MGILTFSEIPYRWTTCFLFSPASEPPAYYLYNATENGNLSIKLLTANTNKIKNIENKKKGKMIAKEIWKSY